MEIISNKLSLFALANAFKTSLSHAWAKPEEVVVERPNVRERILGMDIQSQLELLPRELIWPLIEYAPESIPCLRLVRSSKK